MKPCFSNIVDDFSKEFMDALNNYNACVDGITNRALELDKKVFQMYDYVSKVIPSHRAVDASDVVALDDYLTLLNDFEYIYEKLKESL